MRYFNLTDNGFLPSAVLVVLLTICAALSASAQNLETREIDLKGCIPTSFGEEFIIQTRADLLKIMRTDASRDACLKNVEKIDFDKYALLGIELNTGYCRRPLGLKGQAVRNEAEKQIQLQITYVEPTGTCRALIQYDLWLLIPKIPEKYSIKFDVKATERP